jgi:hypothetical protein
VLAFFFLRSGDADKLLVVAPKNAFGAWDERIEICVPGSAWFTRLRGGRDRIERERSAPLPPRVEKRGDMARSVVRHLPVES